MVRVLISITGNYLTMKANEVFIPAITGTSFMTLFSYIAGEIEDENFSEPDLLSKLYNRIDSNVSTQTSKIAGWNTHYLIGVAFALIYAELWHKMKLRPGIKHGLAVGAISGVTAIAAWATFFKLHPAPPGIHFKKYYAQLWVAHIMFGIVAALTYKFIKDREIKKKQDAAVLSRC